MVLLPVVERELRVAARGRAMYRFRFYAVLVMVAIFAWSIMALGQNVNTSQAGLIILGALSAWAFIFSLLIGVVATSDSVSHEKREGTLGLLFLTDLRGYDVICGKLAANSVNAFYALVATLPVLSIPLLMGGVTFAQFSKLALVQVSTLVLSLAIGIFVSTYSRQERKAMVFTLLLLLAAAFLLPFVFVMGLEYFAPFGNPEWLGMMFSPAYGFYQTLAPAVVAPPAVSFWFSVAWQWLVAAALITRACGHVAHSWEESGAERNPGPRFFNRPLLSQSKFGAHRPWLDKNPFLWLAMRGEASRGRVWMFVVAIVLIWLLAVVKYDMRLMVEDGMLAVTLFVLHVPLKIWIASEASRRFVDDRGNNTFEFLLSTPLTERQIIRGQWLALWHQFAGPIGALLVWEAGIAAYLRHHNSLQWFGPTYEVASQLLTMFFLVLDAVALGWVGMWLGLVARGRTRAILGSLVLVLGVPWVLGWIWYVIEAWIVRSMGLSPDNSVPVAIRVCYALLMNGVAIFWIRRHLPEDLRRLATEQQTGHFI